MALHLINVMGEELVDREVLACLREGLVAEGRVVVLAPSFAVALRAQRELAYAEGLSLGVQVTTPLAWADERWGVWGDGRRFVDAVSRDVLCSRVVAAAAAAEGSLVHDDAGSRALLSKLVEKGLPWLRGRAGRMPEGVTAAEAALASCADAYDAALAALGLMEACDAGVLLPGLLAKDDRSPVVLLGFSSLARWEQELVCGLAKGREVHVFSPLGRGPASAPARLLFESLEDRARAAGVGVSVAIEGSLSAGPVDEGGAGPRARGLERLVGALFGQGEGEVDPEGALRVLLPAGPAAEPGLIADEVARAAAAGARDVVIAASDARRAWRELSERLLARGVSVRTQLSVPVSDLEPGRAFLQLAREVARLSELAEGWPEPRRVGRGCVAVELADMSWWPPRDLSDYLVSGISGVDPARARALDASWRGNRLLTPMAVLDALQNERLTSAATAQAVRELLRGRIGSAASKLLAPIVGGQGDEPADAAPSLAGQAALEAKAALGQVLAVAKSLKECGLSADPAAPRAIPLSELVDVAEGALERTKAVVRLERTAPQASCAALIASSVEGLAPCSADVVVACGQTTTESAVSTQENELFALAEAYGIEGPKDAMAEARRRFDELSRVPRRALVLERCLFGADSKELYPSVMMSEALACCGIGFAAKPSEIAAHLGAANVVSRSEAQVGENCSYAGAAPASEGPCDPMPAGKIDAGLAPCVSPPPEGTPTEKPLLSASQIETYLECPYKWFSLRRLRLRDADATFGGAEMGTFAHRVLEVTHKNLLAFAKERELGTSELLRICKEEPDGMQSEAFAELASALVAEAQKDPLARVPGSRPSASAEDAPGALALLDAEFDAHLSHQYFLAKGKRPQPQALVAHTAAQAGAIDLLRRDLRTLVDYESAAFAGYEPRFFEWGFGRRGAYVEYAGVQLTGTVDRIDVDAHGQAAVIDYKHKSDAGFAGEYDAFGDEGAAGGDFALPRRVQSLIYGQVVRRAFPELKVRAAVYLCTKGGHEIAGAVDEGALDNVFGAHAPSSRRLSHVEVPRSCTFGQEGGEGGMDALLDACEQAIAARIERMLAGDIEAEPLDAAACQYCPVLNCERRLSK